MKKIIALLLVLMLTLTIFVACNKNEEPENPDNKPGTEQNPGTENPGDEDPGVIEHDNVGELENTNQHDGAGLELPIVPIQ